MIENATRTNTNKRGFKRDLRLFLYGVNAAVVPQRHWCSGYGIL
jgi:hypothetical protein